MTEPPRPPWEGNPGGNPPPDQPPSDRGGDTGPSTAPGESGASYPPPGDGGASSYPPPGGSGDYYPPPGAQYGWQPGGTPAGPPQTGYPSAEDRNWILAAHFGGAVVGFFTTGTLGWIVPLVALVARGNQSPAVRQHAVNALNFQILWAIIAAAGYILGTCLAITVVGLVFYLAVPAAMFVELIVGLIAGAKANEGQLYRYPASVNFIK